MNLSNFVYDLYDEHKNLQKSAQESDLQTGGSLFRLLLAHERTCALLVTYTEKLKIFEKELKSEKEKLTKEAESLVNDKATKKDICRQITENIGEFKVIEQKILKKDQEKREEVTSRYEESMREMTEAYAKYDSATTEELKAENDRLKAEINTEIEAFKQREQTYQDSVKGLREEFDQIQSALTARYEDLQRQIQELDETKGARDLAKTRAENLRQKLTIYHEKVPEFYQMIEFKDTQYRRYVQEVKEIIDRYFEQYLDRKRYTEMSKETSEVYLDVHSEVG